MTNMNCGCGCMIFAYKVKCNFENLYKIRGFDIIITKLDQLQTAETFTAFQYENGAKIETEVVTASLTLTYTYKPYRNCRDLSSEPY